MISNPLTGESQLFFANKDDMDFKPLGIVKDSVFEPETPIEVNPTRSFSFESTAFSNKELETMCQSKPNNLKYPNKKRKFRIQKKWFNRYTKPRVIGAVLYLDNLQTFIYDAKLSKKGLSLFSKP